MRGLLIKDFLTVQKQAKVYFVMMIVFLFVPGMEWYTLFLSALLPITAFAYDEKCKWDKLARMLPYSDWDIIASKYLFGYIWLGACCVLGLLAQFICKTLGISAAEQRMYHVLISAGMGLISIAINLPIMFRKGVEKMRIFLTCFTALLMVFTGVSLPDASMPEWEQKMYIRVSLGILGFAVLVQIISMKISVKMYQKQME